MKKLMLLRHAKSDWSAEYGEDRNRPLSERGERDARLIGRFLSEFSLEPELILTSPAVRARQTVELATGAGAWDCRVEVVPEIYGAAPEDLLKLLQRQSEEDRLVMFVGHNPTFEQMVSLLLGGGSVRMSTAALCRIEFPARSWASIRPGTGLLRWFVTPKLLTRGERRERKS